jgi:hypothetical protein
MRAAIVLVTAGALFYLPTAHGWELPAEATVLDSHIIWDETTPPALAISPDSRFIAYVSRGALWKCAATAGPPEKLADLPNTSTALLSMPDYRQPKNSLHSLGRELGFETLHNLLDELHDLRWTRSQDGITFGLCNHTMGDSFVTNTAIHVSLTGQRTTIATIERDSYEHPQRPTFFHVTADKKFTVVAGSSELLMSYPLIWDARTNRPRMTPFDYLLPSTTSDRFLGVEIDTRQLVLVDRNFDVIKRFEVTLDPRQQCDLFWSPDERYAIYCTHTEKFPKSWLPVRIDLETGESTPLKEGFVTDRYYFTGNQSEVVKTGIVGFQSEHVDNMIGGHLSLIAPQVEDSHMIAFFKREPKGSSSARSRQLCPPVCCSPDFQFFVVAWPKEDKHLSGFHYHLADRSGNRWPLPDPDNGEYLSPYRVLGFVNDGKHLLGYRGGKLFTVPVAAIKVGEGRE